jgi:hypothetical protein
MERSLSVRLGKFGITYTTQEGSSDQASSRKEVSSRPTTSFAQEFSLALARESGSTPSLSSRSYHSSQRPNRLVQNQAFQAYTFQADYQAAVSTPSFSAMV